MYLQGIFTLLELSILLNQIKNRGSQIITAVILAVMKAGVLCITHT